MGNERQPDIILRVLLIALIMSTFLSGFAFEYRFIKLNVSQLIAILLFGWLLSVSLARNLKIPIFFKDSTSFFIYLYFLSNLFSSLLFSPNKTQSLKGSIVILTYVFIYFTTRWALKFFLDSTPMIRRMMRYNFISAVVGFGCMLVALISSSENFGVSYSQLDTAGISTLEGHVPSIKSFSTEPNLFSILTATILCINFTIYMLWGKSRKELLVISILSISIIFAYTRSVYIAIFVSMIGILILSRQIKALKSIALYSTALILIVGSLFVFLPENSAVRDALEARARTLVDFKSGSGLGRLEGYRTAYHAFQQDPLFGKGTLSANTIYWDAVNSRFAEKMGSPGWLSGVSVQALHDTGLVGVIIIFGIFLSVLYANYKTFKLLRNYVIEKSIVMGFIGGNIILFISSQLSSTLWISFPYIYWAINLTYIAQCRKMYQEQNAIPAVPQ